MLQFALDGNIVSRVHSVREGRVMNSTGGPDFVIVDGDDFIAIERDLIAPSSSYGETDGLNGRTVLFYSCMMETPIFLTIMRDWFSEWRRACVSAFEREPPEPETAEAYWHRMGAPLLDDLVKSEPHLASALLKTNGHELCKRCGAKSREAVRYLMMSVDHMVVAPRTVQMDGVAVRLG